MSSDDNFNSTHNATADAAAADGGGGGAADDQCGTYDQNWLWAVDTCGFWVEGVAMSVTGVVAIATSLISIYVFTRKEMRNSFNSLIVALTAVDLLFCVLLMADFTFARAFGLYTVAYYYLYPYFTYPVTNIMLSASIYYTVALGLERYIAVCFPLVHRDLAHTYSVGRRVLAYTIPVAIISVAINAPKFLETRIVVLDTVAEEWTGGGEDGENATVTFQNVSTYTFDVTDLRNDPIYIKYYMNVARTVLLGIAPFAALIFFNVKIYFRFLHTRARYSRNNNNSSQAKDLQLAMILVCIVCMFFVTNLPRLLLNLYELFYVDHVITCGDNFIPPVWFMCMTSVNHLLLVLNCIMNFVVYCCFNAGFKRVVLKLAGRAVEAASDNAQMELEDQGTRLANQRRSMSCDANLRFAVCSPNSKKVVAEVKAIVANNAAGHHSNSSTDSNRGSPGSSKSAPLLMRNGTQSTDATPAAVAAAMATALPAEDSDDGGANTNNPLPDVVAAAAS